MENTLATSAKEHTTGCNFVRRNSAARLILRMGLGGLALLLWQAAPVKAQECCPDSNTAAEMARFESTSKKPVNMQTAKMQQGNSVASAKMSAGTATGAIAAANRKSKMYAKPPAVKEAVQKEEAASDGSAQSQGGEGGRS
ncbi:MAG: hypothetical protein WBL50_15670 [Candidatus Acidiferrum sp.]